VGKRGVFLGALTGAAVLSVFACQWGENGVARLEQLNPPPDGAVSEGGAPSNGSSCALPDDPDAGSPESPSTSCLGLISGQWAVRLVQFENIAPLGPSDVWNLTITDLFLASPSNDATSLALTFCGEENSLTNSNGQPEALGENTVPPPLVTALANAPLSVPLPGNGTIQASQVVWLWGLRNLANPATDPLPNNADAGTVWDQDMDGNPGVTVDVVSPMGEIYLVKRAVLDFAQSSGSGGWYIGSLQSTIDQSIVGATSVVLDINVPITTNSNCTSVYQVKCVDPSFTCASLVQGYQTLFANAPTAP
jgi:hypothetical protein